MRGLEEKRVLMRGINYLVGTIALYKKNDNINYPYYVEVQHIIKEWDIAINYKNGRQLILNMFGE